MLCPHCNSELIYDSYMYKGNLAAYEKGYEDSGFEKTGDIWYCPNREGFDDLDQAKEYKELINSEEPIEEVICDSSIFNGHFWTDLNNNLHEGYPC